jgi:hypothetical protein
MEGEMVGVGTITVGMEEDNHYYVICGNMLPTDKVEKLNHRLTMIQNMNQDELKQYYKEQRRMTPDVESKGAGLGFIEMARKSSSAIEFDFHRLDEINSYFTIKATF